jgi:hypothetical protein
LFSDESQYLHIGFAREVDREPDRRKRKGFGQKPPTPASRPDHGAVVAQATTTAIAAANSSRASAGISPDNLVVLEVLAANYDLRDFIEGRFKGWVVDEASSSGDNGVTNRYLIQFPSKSFLSTARLVASNRC